MNAVAYCHPFVPPEWIAAHGLRPCWLPCRAGDEPAVWVRRGVCPVAASRLDDFAGELPAEAVVLTTTCDQIRYAAALLQHLGTLPVFLLHVPRTWQTAAARAFYRQELNRLGRFLVACGGASPKDDALSQTMLRYDRARTSLLQRRGEMSASAFAQAIAAVRGHLAETTPPGCGSETTALLGREFNALGRQLYCRPGLPDRCEGWQYNCHPNDCHPNDCHPNDLHPNDLHPNDLHPNDLHPNDLHPNDLHTNDCHPNELQPNDCHPNDCPETTAESWDANHHLPLALVGGPMSQGDYELLSAVEAAGGRFVLDATESGERTLPAPLDTQRLKADPQEELVRIYFDCIPDVFQRPNDRLFAWLREQVAQRRVRGIMVRRYVWCDHWHGEMPRLREELAVPVLEWDGAGNDPRSRAGIVGRMEAFLEMLR